MPTPAFPQENESYRDELQRCQRKLLKLNRDKSFLLDRLLLYETAVNSSDSETTEGSDTEGDSKHGRYVGSELGRQSRGEVGKFYTVAGNMGTL